MQNVKNTVDSFLRMQFTTLCWVCITTDNPLTRRACIFLCTVSIARFIVIARFQSLTKNPKKKLQENWAGAEANLLFHSWLFDQLRGISFDTVDHVMIPGGKSKESSPIADSHKEPPDVWTTLDILGHAIYIYSVYTVLKFD